MPAMKLVAFAATALIAVTGCNVMRGEQEPSGYIDDTALTARVKSALLDDEQVEGTRYNVDVFQGKVTLTGVANSAEEAQRAEDIARQVPGVREVESTIRVAQADEPQAEPQ